MCVVLLVTTVRYGLERKVFGEACVPRMWRGLSEHHVQILSAGGRAQINTPSPASTPARQDSGLIVDYHLFYTPLMKLPLPTIKGSNISSQSLKFKSREQR